MRGSVWGGGNSMDQQTRSALNIGDKHPLPSRQPAWADHDSIKPNLILGPGAVFQVGRVNVLVGGSMYLKCVDIGALKCTQAAPQLLHPYNRVTWRGASYGNNYRDRQPRGSESTTGHACLLNKLRHTCFHRMLFLIIFLYMNCPKPDPPSKASSQMITPANSRLGCLLQAPTPKRRG